MRIVQGAASGVRGKQGGVHAAAWVAVEYLDLVYRVGRPIEVIEGNVDGGIKSCGVHGAHHFAVNGKTHLCVPVVGSIEAKRFECRHDAVAVQRCGECHGASLVGTAERGIVIIVIDGGADVVTGCQSFQEFGFVGRGWRIGIIGGGGKSAAAPDGAAHNHAVGIGIVCRPVEQAPVIVGLRVGKCTKGRRVRFYNGPETGEVALGAEYIVVIGGAPAATAAFPADQAGYAVNDHMAALADGTPFHTVHGHKTAVVVGCICLVKPHGIMAHVHARVVVGGIVVVLGDAQVIHVVTGAGIAEIVTGVVVAGSHTILVTIRIGRMAVQVAEVEIVLAKNRDAAE